MDSTVRKRTTSKPKVADKEKRPSPKASGFQLKTVVVFLVLLFTVVFTGTYLFLGSIGVGHDNLGDIVSAFDEATKQRDFDSASNVEEKKETKSTLSSQQSEPLSLPTIVWWTDKLFPHFQGKKTVEIECDYGGLNGVCLTTTDKTVLSDPLARGVMFYGSDFRSYETPLPRQPWHEWALLHEESPLNNQILSHSALMSLFNHTSTSYRNSHFPLTTQHIKNLQYLTERKPVPIASKNRFREKLAPIAYIQTHCNVPSDRDRYIKELMKHIQVDSYGKCVNNKKLPENLKNPVESMDSPEFYNFIARYKFHIAFENGICEDYITEKLTRPLHLGSVPIYRGSPSVVDWTPDDHSIILAQDFASPKDLADFIKRLDEDDKEYLSYLEFKETGIYNELLGNTMRERIWGVNDWRKPSFINAFECYLCNQITERLRVERAHEVDASVPLLPPRTAEHRHASCPEPQISVGDLSRAGRGDDIHFWREDYWNAKTQAEALKRMIEKGGTDASKLFDEVQRMFLEGGGEPD